MGCGGGKKRKQTVGPPIHNHASNGHKARSENMRPAAHLLGAVGASRPQILGSQASIVSSNRPSDTKASRPP